MEQTPSFKKGMGVLDCILEKHPDQDQAYPKAYHLMGLIGLTQFGEDHPVDQLSGGWQKRLALARELVLDPDLLILDEPTNHLDVSSILWLEEFLSSSRFSVLMVTHDRLFLQRVATRIIDLDPRNPNYLLLTNGNYADYLETKNLELAALKRHEKVQKNTLRRELEWLGRGAIARIKKQSARIQSTEALREDVADLERKNQNKKVALHFGEAERNPKKLIEAIGISKKFGENTLFEDLDLLITPKTRLGLIGDNGCGKSTLIKILLGTEKPSSGKVEQTEKIQISYFEQNTETLDFNKSVLKNVVSDGDYVDFQGQSLHVRSYLDRFLFSGIKVDLPAGKLSGGEQARLRLAKIMLKSCQVLVLDEPTNDLDSDTLDVLEAALEQFQGAVIIVSHDRYFLDAVSNQLLAFPPKEWLERGVQLQKFADYFQWENWFKEEGLRQIQESKMAQNKNSGAQKKVKLSFKEKFELENMESSISELEQKVESLSAKTQDSEALSDHKKLSQVLEELAQAQAELDRKYKRWEELEAKTKG